MSKEVDDLVSLLARIMEAEPPSPMSGTSTTAKWLTEENRWVETVRRFTLINGGWSWTLENITDSPGEIHEYTNGLYTITFPDGHRDERPQYRFSSLPNAIKLLHPRKLDIWGRRADRWRPTGATQIDDQTAKLTLQGNITDVNTGVSNTSLLRDLQFDLTRQIFVSSTTIAGDGRVIASREIHVSRPDPTWSYSGQLN